MKPYIGVKADAMPYLTQGCHLETGWRINFFSYKQAFCSMFMIHNETVNIWSHLIGSVVFMGLAFYVAILTAFKDPELATKMLDQAHTPVMPLYISVGSAIVMLGASAYFHLFLCQNEHKCIKL